MRVLVVDVGTSSVRAVVVRDDATFEHETVEEFLPHSPADGVVEFDAAALGACVVRVARAALDRAGHVDGVAVSNQRASTVLWLDDGTPLGPGIGWQDLRTIGLCFAARGHGLRLAPNQSATKAQWLLEAAAPLDVPIERLRIGTVDSWVVWVLTEGATHLTDPTNAGVTGLVQSGFGAWDDSALDALGIPRTAMATIVDSAGACATASALPGAPPIVAVLGDQQASLVGQACVRPGDAKITFGTGGMLDMVFGPTLPSGELHGTFPIATWRVDGRVTWGIESAMLAAGTNVQWLRDGLGLVPTSAATHDIAAQCIDSGGVVYVPALMGLGTPRWDYGARSGFFGITRGTSRAEMVRAVLEGVAHRGTDLVEAAEAAGGTPITALRVDGGMSDNPTFVRALADASQRPVEIAPVREATALGAGLFGHLALGTFATVDELATTWTPRAVVTPGRPLDRDHWRSAVERVTRWIPELSGVEF